LDENLLHATRLLIEMLEEHDMFFGRTLIEAPRLHIVEVEIGNGLMFQPVADVVGPRPNVDGQVGH
jgi:hypothetical protein